MFENPSALMLLALLVPVIILYLLKPKPRNLNIPSLMLLLPETGKKNKKALLRTFVRDPLLLIQLITIAILVLGMANPYFAGSAQSRHTVIVLDSSASMAATDVKPDRFSQAVDIAREYVENSDRVSVILAQDTPLLLLKEADHRKALDTLSHLGPKATGTHISDAMLLASGLFENDKVKLAVISDFSSQDITQASKIVEAKGIQAEYRQTGTGGANAGIVDAAVEGGDLKFFVKNYGDSSMEVRIDIIHGNLIKSINKTLKQRSVEFFRVPDIGAGKTRVVITPDDELTVDNTLYISMPESGRPRVLLISDAAVRGAPVSLAFNSIPSVEVNEITFDRAPRAFDYDLVVLHDYKQDSALPGTMDDLRKYVEGGGTLVFVADRELQSMDTGGLLPVNVSGTVKLSRIKSRNDELTKGIDFGTSGYLEAVLKKGAVELASGEEGPVLASWNRGKGKVVYLGINDMWGEFHLLPSYPVFWFNLLNSATAMELNFKTGTLLPLGEVKHVEAPGSAFETDSLYLDETGFYKIGEKTIASNLLDELESDISIKGFDLEGHAGAYGKNIEKMHVDTVLSVLAILLIALELYYLKNRGDI